MLNVLSQDEIRHQVRERYGSIVKTQGSCCTSSSCGSLPSHDPAEASLTIGYHLDDLAHAPAGANLGLGCGNPQAIASLQEGETVLDLGSGAGFDAFLAAKQVGTTGQVIGVDMTPEMITQARTNQTKGAFDHVEFRLGEIEALPIADASIDVIISNCVINLSPDKPRVFREAFRVLKPGGRLAIADVVALKAIPAELQNDFDLYTGCMAGASPVAEIKQMLQEAGFIEISLQRKGESRDILEN